MVDTDIKPSNVLQFESYTSENGLWQFYHTHSGMSSTKELDMLQDQAECELPEVFYGKNLFLIAMSA